LDDAEFIPVNIRPSKEIDIGEDVYAIGNPEGYERTISKGIISNKDNINGKFMLQTDAPISHGSSGGGLFDVHANLIGITTLIGSEGENLGFAIPSEILLAQVNPNLLPKGGSIQATSSLNTDKNTNRSLTKMDYSVPSLIGYYGDSKIGLFRWGTMCIITITGRYSKSDNEENESLAIWAPTIPNTLMVIPSTADINKATRYLFRFVADEGADFQPTRSIMIFDKKLFEMKYENNLSEKYSVMDAVMKEDITQSLIVDDDFSIQFYQYRSQPGMTTVRFALDGFTEALAAYNKSCGK
jgi:serine protease Do